MGGYFVVAWRRADLRSEMDGATPDHRSNGHRSHTASVFTIR
jgi:hypothetical protein